LKHQDAEIKLLKDQQADRDAENQLLKDQNQTLLEQRAEEHTRQQLRDFVENRETYDSFLSQLQVLAPLVRSGRTTTHKSTRRSTDLQDNTSASSRSKVLTQYADNFSISASKFNQDKLPAPLRNQLKQLIFPEDSLTEMIAELFPGLDMEVYVTRWVTFLCNAQDIFIEYLSMTNMPDSEVICTQPFILRFLQEMASDLGLCAQVLKSDGNIYVTHLGSFKLSGKYDLVRVNARNQIRHHYEVKRTQGVTSHSDPTKNQMMAENLILLEQDEQGDMARGLCFDLFCLATVWSVRETRIHLLEPVQSNERSIILRLMLSFLDLTADHLSRLLSFGMMVSVPAADEQQEDQLNLKLSGDADINPAGSAPAGALSQIQEYGEAHQPTPVEEKDNLSDFTGSDLRETSADDYVQSEEGQLAARIVIEQYTEDCRKGGFLPLFSCNLRKQKEKYPEEWKFETLLADPTQGGSVALPLLTWKGLLPRVPSPCLVEITSPVD
jgi:hypothetical protein